MPLTVKQIDAARFGTEKERLSDGGGLYLRLFPNGSKRFQVQIARGKGSASRGWITLGEYPDLTLKAARGLAAQVRAKSSEGKDIETIRDVLANTTGSERQPVQMRSTGRVRKSRIGAEAARHIPGSDILLRDAARHWFSRKRETLSNGKHIDQNWNTVATYILPHLGERPVSSIRRREIIETLRPIWHVKHTTAARTLARLKEIIALALIDNDLDIANPAQFCTRTAFGYMRKQTAHHAALPPERLPEFWAWLETVKCEEQIRIATQLLILSAKRTGEVRLAEWEHVCLTTKIWATQAEMMKMRRQHRVPLSAQAIAVLENAAMFSSSKKLVIAKPRTRSGSISENGIRNLVQRFDPDLTGHGFRASFKTWARVQGCYNFDAIEYALAHVPDKLEQAYMRDDLIKERAPLMQDWADFVTQKQMPRSALDRLERAP